MKKEEFVKLGISEELAQKAAEASTEELKGFIPRYRFDEVSEENKALTEDIKSRDSQIAELSKIDAAKLQERINELREENKANDAKRKEEAKAYEKKIAETRLEAAIDIALKDAGARNVDAVKALIKRDVIKIDGDDVSGLSEQVKTLTEDESTSFMFKSQEAPNISGLKAGQGASGTEGAQGNYSLGEAVAEAFKM